MRLIWLNDLIVVAGTARMQARMSFAELQFIPATRMSHDAEELAGTARKVEVPDSIIAARKVRGLGGRVRRASMLENWRKYVSGHVWCLKKQAVE